MMYVPGVGRPPSVVTPQWMGRNTQLGQTREWTR